MPYTKEQVYQPENLRFATKSKGRDPTLYFRTNHGSGRLRQEHKNGPKVQDVRKHTTHAFFQEKQHARDFYAAAKQQHSDGVLTRDAFRDLRKQHGGRHTPFANAFHVEGTFKGHAGHHGLAKFQEGSKRKKGLHKSQGQVVDAEELRKLKANTPNITKHMGAF
jgi:hypothetical protein